MASVACFAASHATFHGCFPWVLSLAKAAKAACHSAELWWAHQATVTSAATEVAPYACEAIVAGAASGYTIKHVTKSCWAVAKKVMPTKTGFKRGILKVSIGICQVCSKETWTDSSCAKGFKKIGSKVCWSKPVLVSVDNTGPETVSQQAVVYERTFPPGDHPWVRFGPSSQLMREVAVDGIRRYEKGPKGVTEFYETKVRYEAIIPETLPECLVARSHITIAAKLNSVQFGVLYKNHDSKYVVIGQGFRVGNVGVIPRHVLDAAPTDQVYLKGREARVLLVSKDKWASSPDLPSIRTQMTALDVASVVLAPNHWNAIGIAGMNARGLANRTEGSFSLQAVQDNGTVHQSYGALLPTSFEDTDAGRTQHSASTMQGWSGAPLLSFQNGKPYLYGMHLGQAKDGKGTNIAIYTAALVDILKYLGTPVEPTTKVLWDKMQSAMQDLDAKKREEAILVESRDESNAGFEVNRRGYFQGAVRGYAFTEEQQDDYFQKHSLLFEKERADRAFAGDFEVLKHGRSEGDEMYGALMAEHQSWLAKKAKKFGPSRHSQDLNWIGNESKPVVMEPPGLEPAPKTEKPIVEDLSSKTEEKPIISQAPHEPEGSAGDIVHSTDDVPPLPQAVHEAAPGLTLEVPLSTKDLIQAKKVGDNPDKPRPQRAGLLPEFNPKGDFSKAVTGLGEGARWFSRRFDDQVDARMPPRTQRKATDQQVEELILDVKRGAYAICDIDAVDFTHESLMESAPFAIYKAYMLAVGVNLGKYKTDQPENVMKNGDGDIMMKRCGRIKSHTISRPSPKHMDGWKAAMEEALRDSEYSCSGLAAEYQMPPTAGDTIKDAMEHSLRMQCAAVNAPKVPLDTYKSPKGQTAAKVREELQDDLPSWICPDIAAGPEGLDRIIEQLKPSSCGISARYFKTDKAGAAREHKMALWDIVICRYLLNRSCFSELPTMSAEEIVAKGLADPRVIEVKKEPHNRKKWTTGRWRLIWVDSLVDTVLTMLLTSRITQATKRGFQEGYRTSHAAGLGHHDEGLQHLIAMAKRYVGDSVETSDKSSYDLRVSREMKMLYGECLINCLHPGLREHYGLDIYAMLLTQTAPVAVIGPHVWCATIYGLTPSGTFITTHANTTCEAGYTKLCDGGRCLCAGDDTISSERANGECLEQLGQKMKEGSVEWQSFSDPRGVSFTSHRLSDHGCAFLGTEKMLARLLLADSPPTPQQLGSCLFVLRNNPEDRKLLLEAARKYGMDLAELERVAVSAGDYGDW